MKFQLTTQGKTLQSSLQAGKTLTFTKVEGGSTYSQNPEALLAVQSKKQTLQLNEVVIDSESEKAKLSMTLTNIGITEGYDLKQIGIYAKTEDTDEILFIVGQDSKGETVPAITDKEVEFDYSLWFSYDNSYEINLSVSDNDFVKKTMYDSDQKKVNQRIELLEEPEFDDTGEVEGITDRASLLSSFVSKMPMVKFLRNIKAGFKLALYAGEIVNDCVTDNSALPLSAAQGKALMDLYTVLNTKLIEAIGNIKARSLVDKQYIYLHSTQKYGIGFFFTNKYGGCIITFNGAKTPTVTALRNDNDIIASYDADNDRFIIDGKSAYCHWLILLGGTISSYGDIKY